MRLQSNSEGVAFEIVFKISPMNRVEFLQTMDSLVMSTTQMAGLGSQTCFEQVGKKNTFLWRECWGSRAEVEDRLQSGAIKTLLGAIGVLGELDRLEVLAPQVRLESGVGLS